MDQEVEQYRIKVAFPNKVEADHCRDVLQKAISIANGEVKLPIRKGLGFDAPIVELLIFVAGGLAAPALEDVYNSIKQKIKDALPNKNTESPTITIVMDSHELTLTLNEKDVRIKIEGLLRDNLE